MTLAELKTTLTAVTGFAEKVAYYQYPENEAPELPFIAFYETGAGTVYADGIVYYSSSEVGIELYTLDKDEVTEAAVETALTGAGLAWTKTCDRIESENCWMITYTTNL